jgi:hypothetical protein
VFLKKTHLNFIVSQEALYASIYWAGASKINLIVHHSFYFIEKTGSNAFALEFTFLPRRGLAL